MERETVGLRICLMLVWGAVPFDPSVECKEVGEPLHQLGGSRSANSPEWGTQRRL